MPTQQTTSSATVTTQSNPFQNIQNYMQDQAKVTESSKSTAPQVRSLVLPTSLTQTLTQQGNPFFQSEHLPAHGPNTFMLFWQLINDVLHWGFQRVWPSFGRADHPLQELDFQSEAKVNQPSLPQVRHEALGLFSLPTTEVPADCHVNTKTLFDKMLEATPWAVQPPVQASDTSLAVEQQALGAKQNVEGSQSITIETDTEATLPTAIAYPTLQDSTPIDAVMPVSSEPVAAFSTVTDLTDPAVLAEEHIHARSQFVRSSLDSLVDAYFASKEVAS
ncbi:MAG: hypothetical protein ACKO34_02495 [Vampirovibrionales bacterium]